MKKLIALSAPSGVGKTTIAHEIMKRHPEIAFSVSATTRPRRPNEVHGEDYYFLTKEEFRTAIQQGRFVEWEEIYGDFYGTLKSEIDRVLGMGLSIVFDIDVKGAVSIKQQYPEAALIFIKPPSIEVAQNRLANRKTENPESITRRIERMPMELAMESQFDYSVVNDDLEHAIAEVESIITRD